MNNLLLSKDYGSKRYVKRGTIHICKCGKEFYVRPSKNERAKYCSRRCTNKWKKSRPKIGKWIPCGFCKKQVWVRPYNFHRKYTFCSFACMKKYDFGGKLKLKCKKCKRQYETYKSHKKYYGSAYCSRECMWKHKKGKKSNNWKGGVALKKQLWTIFSKYIRIRDDGVCFSCGKKDDWKNTDAGHYVPKTAGLALYFDEKNVNCQCTACNRFRHGNLSQYALALRQKYGEKILEELEWKRRQITRIK